MGESSVQQNRDGANEARTLIERWDASLLQQDRATIADHCRTQLQYGDGLIAELVEACYEAESFIQVMFGNGKGQLPETIETPLGVPVKIREIYKSVSSAIIKAVGL